jgi:hypothetical protein
MATNWDSDMQDKFDKLQAALTEEFRTQFEASEQRLDARLSQRLKVQAEELREIVRTAADNYGGVLSAIKGDLTDFRDEWRKKTGDTDKVLANHGGRIDAIEKTLSSS